MVGDFDVKTGELMGCKSARIDPKFKRFRVSGDDKKDIDGRPMQIDTTKHPTLPIHFTLSTK